MSKTKLPLVLFVFLGLALATFAATAPTLRGQAQPVTDCTLLDTPSARGRMSAMYERRLLEACGRLDELPASTASSPISALFPTLTDVLVSDPTGESGPTQTQSETSIAINENNGTICSGYNDSYHYTQGMGFTGFSRSTDGGASFDDRGPLGARSWGDPSVAWNRSDGNFYFAALDDENLGLWRSTDDCQTFQFMSVIPAGDDKELISVDNYPSSPYYGRIYAAATNFGAGGNIYATYTDNGTTWSTPIAVSGGNVQGAWPAVAPNGDVYISWVHWDSYPSGPIDIEVTRSTNGGASYTRTTDALSNAVNPRDAGASSTCGRPALNGDIRYLPSPQIAVGPDGVVHVVYSYDPDGYNSGDVINVYYRRSLDHGATWQPEVLLNDDATLTDQFFPSLSVSDSAISSAWYDRRLDPSGNYLFTYYARVSRDGGTTWEPSEQVGDALSPVYYDPATSACYHGDYDQQAQFDGAIYIQWSDDRLIHSGHNDPDVWFDKKFVSADFKLAVAPETQSICVPAQVTYTVDLDPIWIFNQPVTLTAENLPVGVLASFDVNPVTPPGSSSLSLDTTAGAAGSYEFAVVGQGITLTHAVTLGLELFTSLPTAPELVYPAAEARNVPLRPTFTWQAAEQGQLYAIEVATDMGFTNLVASAMDLAEPSFTPVADLPLNTVLYWRVTAYNPCGSSPWSAPNRFLTETVLGQCALGTAAVTHLSEGFEGLSLPDGWSTAGVGSTWASSLTRKHSGARSFKGVDVNTVSDQWLITPALVLPEAESPLTVSFWNYRKFQTPGCADGGVVEITTDGGATWSSLASQLRSDAYNGVIDNDTNPLYGQPAWCGSGTTWTNAIAALDDFAGETVHLRFRLGTDDSISNEGWYVDDVAVQSCVPSASLQADTSLEAVAGEVITFTFTLANHSLVDDSFALALEAGSYPATLQSASPITVTAGATVTLQVGVDVPAGALGGESDSFMLHATSQTIPGILLHVMGTVTVAEDVWFFNYLPVVGK